ncbi:sulfate permease Ecym_4299 [Eremothecium cymbalariae DBVPG|uniref:STAS domain-containing protein n=1 Tax=Eremothecium cymbalariae (strain CBS 270.75 / DBVPG 7215 / KCTC 17166 / NRRL Y-17582) TaxID=931890 RepID=G8JTK9_ERECY|nr:hypothetical protein Ecym_4299 [Eremothecium cymbalariae DBVPG\
MFILRENSDGIESQASTISDTQNLRTVDNNNRGLQDTSGLDELETDYTRFKTNEDSAGYSGAENERSRIDKFDSVGSSLQFAKYDGNALPDFKAPPYYETTVTFMEYYDRTIRSRVGRSFFRSYFLSLFPIIKWIHHYNFAWMYSDFIAGITVGCVLVPQSMSYAQLAGLKPEYGLYSSFIGAFIYSFFATSKDVCIGPVAVMSVQVSKVISHVIDQLPEGTPITAPMVASALALFSSILVIPIGLLRLGFILELISVTAVAGFMTGSALSILASQLPSLLGIQKINTRVETYRVLISTLKHLNGSDINAAFGLICLALLFFWKWTCGYLGPKLISKYLRPNSKKARIWQSFFFYAQALRNAFVLFLATFVSWLVIGRHKKKTSISVLGTVPSGLKHVGVPTIPSGLVHKLMPQLPPAVIILLLEHITIAKSFGRINNYKIVPDQELIAIGVTNLIGSFFNAYPATGSFSRSALKAKCNVKTPLSGLFSGACVLLALYYLTSAFYYIPKAALSAVIIHAVVDLIASYKLSFYLWNTNPFDLISFLATILLTIFSSIENGIYFAVAFSMATLLMKNAFPSGKFLGYVKITEVSNLNVFEDLDSIGNNDPELPQEISKDSKLAKDPDVHASANLMASKLDVRFHTKWVPLDNGYSRELNPEIAVHMPPPGVIVYRPTESWHYLNCSRQFDIIVDRVKTLTRPGKLVNHLRKSEQLWCEPGDWVPPLFLRKFFKKYRHKAAKPEVVEQVDNRPVLKILAMDWTQVTHVDSTSIQSLIDLRKTINRYADRQVGFHFSGIVSPWIKRALVHAGFGTINENYSNDPLLLKYSTYHVVQNVLSADEENQQNSEISASLDVASGTNFPFFHIDMPDFTKWDI